MAKIIGADYDQSGMFAVYVETVEGRQKFVRERHGEWEEVKVKNFYSCMITAYECTNCKKHSVGQVAITMKSDYCPNCGAKMDGKENNNAQTD